MKLSDSVLKYEERVVFALRSLYGAYGYAPFRMSRFEEYDLYVRNKAFLVSDSVITFTDTDGKLMALKPDVTLSIVKNCRPTPGGTEKLYYDENVFRVSQGTHAFRELRQVGLECIGTLDAVALGEVLCLAADSLGVIAGEYVLDVSHLGVVGAVIAALGLGEAAASALLEALSAKNPHGILSVLASEGIDASRGEELLALCRTAGPADTVIPTLRTALAANGAALSALRELEAVLAAAPHRDGIRVDFSVIHDMHYYNGIVFRGFVPSASGRVLSGGQYDRLAEKLGRAEGAVGFAVYLDTLGGGEAVPPPDGVFLLYGEGDDPRAVLSAADRLRADGSLVRCGRVAPTDGSRVVTLGEVTE